MTRSWWFRREAIIPARSHELDSNPRINLRFPESAGEMTHARPPLPAALDCRATARTAMSQLLLQVIMVVAFGAFCFGCGYLTAFIVTRNQWRDEMIKRGVARYNWTTGKWEWGSRRKNRATE
jgi:hypothetical protein